MSSYSAVIYLGRRQLSDGPTVSRQLHGEHVIRATNCLTNAHLESHAAPWQSLSPLDLAPFLIFDLVNLLPLPKIRVV